MKHFYLLLLAFSSISFSQVVTIPDANLKIQLLEQADANSDGEIQVFEAQAISILSIEGGMQEITNLTGLQAFTNLTKLSIWNVNSPIALDGFNSLQEFYSNGYGPTSITFGSLPSLKKVELEVIFTLTENLVFSNLPALEEIDMMMVTGAPLLSIGNCPNLKKITLDSCVSNQQFSQLPQLEELNTFSAGVTSLNLSNFPNLKRLDCSWNEIGTLDFSAVPNLESVNAVNNNLTTASFNNHPNLKSINLSGNNLTTFNMTNLPQLESLNIVANQISALDLSQSPNLLEFYCDANPLGNVNLSPLTQLTMLSLDETLRTSLDLSFTSSLYSLSCSNNAIGSLNVTGQPDLGWLLCNSTQISELDITQNPDLFYLECSTNTIAELNLSQNHKLQTIRVISNQLTLLDLSAATQAEGGFQIIEASGNPLQSLNIKNGMQTGHLTFDAAVPFVCIDDAEYEFISYLLSQYENNTQLNTYCNFTPGGNFNTINGLVRIDTNNDGCNDFDLVFPELKMKITSSSSQGATFTSDEGNYTFYTDAGSFTTTPELENPYFTISPPSATVNFANPNNNTQQRNFCLVPVGVHYLPEITIIPWSNVAPGFPAKYKVVFRNIGNKPLYQGAVTFAYDETLFDFVSANPTADSQSLGIVSWEYPQLFPFQTLEYFVTLEANTPTETPALNIGDVVTSTASVFAQLGEGLPNVSDSFFLNQTVQGSWDPNDKTCLEGTTMSQQMVGDYLHYLIRFQNSGTAPAVNVVVKDMIDTNKYDIATLRLIDSSHPHETRITGNKVEFIFENIMLPAEEDDEPGSHGYVAFKIKTKSNLTLGNSVSNLADIYFDYNFPITTEPAITTVTALGVADHEDVSVKMYPNPTKNKLFLSADSAITSIAVFDIQGRLLETKLPNDSNSELDLASKTSGVYFVKIKTETGVKTEKIVKE